MDLGKSSPVAQSEEESEEQYKRVSSLVRIIAESPTVAAIDVPAFGGGPGVHI